MSTNNSTFRPRCPTCEMVVDVEKSTKFLPFCSHRCRMVDLGRWLNEEHALPCSSNEEEDTEDASTPSSGVVLPPGWHDA